VRQGKGPKVELPAVAAWDILKARLEIAAALKLARKYHNFDHMDLISATYWFQGERPYDIGLREEDNRLHCAVWLNARAKDCFKRWPGERRFARLMWLLEALFDTVQAKENYEAGDTPDVQVAFSPSPAVTVASLVVYPRFAYIREKRVNRVLRENLSGPDERPLSLSRIHQEDDSDFALNKLISSALDDLPGSIDKAIAPIVQGTSRDEMTGWLRSAEVVGELFMLLSNLCAAFDAESDWAGHQNRLYEHPTFDRYFSSEWPTLHADWRVAASRSRAENRIASPEAVGSLKRIFAKFGIEILDQPEGLSLLRFTSATQAA
jgi:hypothetical protein